MKSAITEVEKFTRGFKGRFEKRRINRLEVKTVEVTEFEEQKGNQMNGFQMRKITSYLN